LFGLNLSQVDAAKVDAANDAFGVIGLAIDGASKQLVVELSPAIQAVSEDFLEAAENAGGMGNMVGDAVDNAVGKIAFLSNALDGVGVLFQVIAKGAVLAFAELELAVKKAGVSALELVGQDASDKTKEKIKLLEGITKEASEDINKTLMEPLAGDAFVKFWEDAQKAADKSATSAVKVREETKKTGEAFDEEAAAREEAATKAADAIVSEITALERAAKVWGMSADEVKIYDLSVQGASASQLSHAQALLDTVEGLEAQKKATEEYQQVAESLRTEEERRAQTLRDQLAAIEAVNDASAPDTKQRAIDAAFVDAPTDGMGQIASGPFSDLFDVNEQEKELDEWYANQMSLLETFRQERSDLNAQWDAKELETKKQHEEAMKQLEMARWNAALSGVSTILGNISALIDTDSKKGKEKAKKLAVAQALINTYTAFTGALASASSIPVIGWIMAPIAAAAALAAGMQQVNAIKGQAHDGIMSVPSSGTWNLEKGERVTTAETSAKLDATLDRVQRSMGTTTTSAGGSRSVTVNQTINTIGNIDGRTSSQIAQDTARKQRIAMTRFG